MSQEINDRLEHLRQASSSIHASADFGERVMLTLANTRGAEVPVSGFWQVTSRWRFVGVAALAATVTLFVAIQSDRETDDLVAASYAATEVDF